MQRTHFEKESTVRGIPAKLEIVQTVTTEDGVDHEEWRVFATVGSARVPWGCLAEVTGSSRDKVTKKCRPMLPGEFSLGSWKAGYWIYTADQWMAKERRRLSALFNCRARAMRVRAARLHRHVEKMRDAGAPEIVVQADVSAGTLMMEAAAMTPRK